MPQREVEVANNTGLDAPASAKLAQLAATFQCGVSLMRRGRRVNAKSLMGVMMLAAGQGSRVVIETDGPDEAEALEAMVRLIGSPAKGTG
jgi:phosphocarrier protein HPr